MLVVRLSWRVTLLTLLLTLTYNVSPAFCQTSAGTLVGVVSDASGALIPGVEITATNQRTNQARQSVSNETGNYRIEPSAVIRAVGAFFFIDFGGHFNLEFSHV